MKKTSRKKAVLKALFSKSQYALFACFFILGFVWGKYYYYGDEQPLEVLFKDKKIHILAEQSKLPDDILESYHLQHQTHISMDTYSSPSEIETLLKEKQFDVVLLPSNMIGSLIQTERLYKLNLKLIANALLISPDFSNLAYDKEGLYTAALLWGVQQDPNGSVLWTTNLAIPNNAQNIKEAHHFINYMLQKDIALEMVKLKKVATTNRELDGSDIESSLKSSFIRQLRLKDLKY